MARKSTSKPATGRKKTSSKTSGARKSTTVSGGIASATSRVKAKTTINFNRSVRGR